MGKCGLGYLGRAFMTRAQPRIPRSVPVGRRRPNPRRALAHLAFLRQLPCIACGASPPCQAAHVRKGTGAGVGIKPADKFALPLCGPSGGSEGCHAKQHRTGEASFWAALGIDAVDTALRLWTVSGDLDAGNRIVFRARQRIALAKRKDG
jgi:hypothetical protein